MPCVGGRVSTIAKSSLKTWHSKRCYTFCMDADTRERSSIDDVIDTYKKDVDMTLIRENLKLTPDQRIRRMIAFMKFLHELRKAGKKAFG